MYIHILLEVFLFSLAISIINGIFGGHGFCHQQQVIATFCVRCGSDFPDSVAVSIVAGENDPNGPYELFCVTPQWYCYGPMTRTFNTTSDTLEIRFIFNHTIHGGRYLRIIRERNGSQQNQHILLKPCFSGFTTNANFYNDSFITVGCQHASFNYSNSPIRIKIEEGTDYGACSKTGCFGCQRLPEGIQCLVPHIPRKAIQCILDGAIYNISVPDIAPTTNSPEITETINTTTQGTSYTSKESKPPTMSHENSHTSTFMTTKNSTPLQSVTTIPKSSATSQKIITTTIQSSSLSHNLTTALTEGSSTSKSITSPDIVSGSQNITTESPNSLSSEQEIATSTEGSNTSIETKGSTAVKETTTAYLGMTVPTNAQSNAAITIINQNVVDQGFCHQQHVTIQLYLDCDVLFSATINVAIVASENENNANILLNCVRSNETTWYCHRSDIMTGEYNASSGSFDISFTFNFTIHAGYYVTVKSSCERNQETKNIYLRPCFPGFTVNANFYNETSLIINCQHSSFNYSSSPIRIKVKGGNDLGACSKSSCNSCKRLPNGIQCEALYSPENRYQCVLNGAILNVSLSTTAPDFQTTLAQNVSTSERVTTPSENTIVSENRVTSKDSSTTQSLSRTSPRSITSSGGSTTFTVITETSTEGTTVQNTESTFLESTKSTFLERSSTTDSTAASFEETSTPQNEIDVSSGSSLTSRENTNSTTVAPRFETTPIQSTEITRASIDDAAITIINKDDFDRGFCHLNDVEIQLCLDCKSHIGGIVDLSIVASVYDTYADNLMSCLRFSDVMWNCHENGIMTGKYNASSNVLDIRFNFNYTKYAGRYLRIKFSSVGDQEITHVLLKACFSEFNVHSTFYNETSLIVNCQHSSFNYSSSSIRIKLEGGNDVGACSKTTCNRCKRLSEGIQCIVPYTPSKAFQCILDGAVYNISIPENHVTQTTLPSIPITSEKTTMISPYRSTLSESLTSIILKGSTTKQSLTSPDTLKTEQSLTTSITNSTTEQTVGTTEPERPPTSTNILSTSQHITTTSPSRSTTSQIITLTSPCTSQESITTTKIPTTSQESISTMKSTASTLKESITTTTKHPTTQIITTSSKGRSETSHGNIKSTTPVEITYNSSGTSIVQRPLFDASLVLIVVAIRLI